MSKNRTRRKDLKEEVGVLKRRLSAEMADKPPGYKRAKLGDLMAAHAYAYADADAAYHAAFSRWMTEHIHLDQDQGTGEEPGESDQVEHAEMDGVTTSP